MLESCNSTRTRWASPSAVGAVTLVQHLPRLRLRAQEAAVLHELRHGRRVADLAPPGDAASSSRRR